MTTFAKPYVAVLDNVTFAFVKMAEPAPTFDKSGTEYTVDAIVSKAKAKEMKKQFPKISVKEIETDEFEAKYKIKPPFPEQDEQFVLKFKKKASKGDEVYDTQFAPKVMLLQADGTSLDITTAKLVSNGSKGKLAYRVAENSFGTFTYLHSILVEDFIEYVPAGGGGMDVFGVKSAGVAPTNPAVIADRKKAEVVGEEKRKQTLAAQQEAEGLDEIPF